MATCDMGYEHDEVIPVAADPEPAVVVDPGPNENDVKIAEIEAEARVETEKMWTEQRGLELEAEVQGLRGELRGMREVLDRVAPPEPEPQPEPVIVPVPEPGPGPDAAPPPPEGDKPPKPDKGSGGWWDSYG